MFIAIAMRFCIALYSTEANDDHSEVIQLILEHGTYPALKDCWECFQPPAFYRAHALIAGILGNSDNIALHRQMQWVNFLFALGTIFLVFRYIMKLELDRMLKLSILAFFLWNPRLASMSVQATNDSIQFFTGTLFLYLLERWIGNSKTGPFLLLALIAVFAASLKGNGLLLLVLLPTGILIARREIRPTLRLILPVYVLLAWAIAFVGGGYLDKLLRYNDPWITNMQKVDPPPLLEDQEWFGARAGIRSVRTGYFTFRLYDLLRTPYQLNDEPEFPKHRTSFLTLLYANFYHGQFANHPNTWKAEPGHWVHQSGRLLFILGLFPLFIFLGGVFQMFRSIFRGGQSKERKVGAVHLANLGVFLAFLIKYSYDYRDFAHIKVLFLFPACLSMVYLTKTGLDLIQKSGPVRKMALIPILFWIVNGLFLLNVAGLIETLIHHS